MCTLSFFYPSADELWHSPNLSHHEHSKETVTLVTLHMTFFLQVFIYFFFLSVDPFNAQTSRIITISALHYMKYRHHQGQTKQFKVG